jgi:hypothetical protein
MLQIDKIPNLLQNTLLQLGFDKKQLEKLSLEWMETEDGYQNPIVSFIVNRLTHGKGFSPVATLSTEEIEA